MRKPLTASSKEAHLFVVSLSPIKPRIDCVLLTSLNTAGTAILHIFGCRGSGEYATYLPLFMDDLLPMGAV